MTSAAVDDVSSRGNVPASFAAKPDKARGCMTPSCGNPAYVHDDNNDNHDNNNDNNSNNNHNGKIH